MNPFRITLALGVLLFGCNIHAEKPGDASALLTQTQVIPLEGVEGRIDHFALDAKGQRLFMS